MKKEAQCCLCFYYRHGECHKLPAVRLPRQFAGDGTRTRDETHIWGWPKVAHDEWCGEYVDWLGFKAWWNRR